jgi:hypothetical protein
VRPANRIRFAHKHIFYAKSIGLSDQSPFLFGNFFFAALVPKKKWIKDKQSLSFVALSIDTKIPLTLFLLRKKAQKKKLCKKKMPFFRLRGGRHL